MSDTKPLFREPSTAPRDSLTYTPPDSTDPIVYVRSWHDDVHAGSFEFCFEQPCHGIQRL